MSISRKSGRGPLFLVLSVVAIGALAALVIAWWPGATQPASADFPHAGVDLAIGVGSTCDSTAGPAKCTFEPNATFTVDFKLSGIPGGFTYAGYDGSFDYAGVTVIEASLVQTGAGVWPPCTFAASDFTTPGHVATACAGGIGAPPSTYTGVLMHVDFTCVASGTVTLLNGEGASDVVDDSLVPHGEAQGSEVLTINCGGGGGETPTNTPPAGPTNTPPAGPTNTPPAGPTNTPVPPTATRTPSGPQPTPTVGVAPTAAALPTLAKTGFGGGLGQSTGDGTSALWLAVVSLLGLTGTSLFVLRWRFARGR